MPVIEQSHYYLGCAWLVIPDFSSHAVALICSGVNLTWNHSAWWRLSESMFAGISIPMKVGYFFLLQECNAKHSQGFRYFIWHRCYWICAIKLFDFSSGSYLSKDYFLKQKHIYHPRPSVHLIFVCIGSYLNFKVYF